jgi:NifU-like protein involved in Fe-S cluster formation
MSKTNLEEAVRKYSGRLNDPSASSRVTGPCGDTMEFYLDIDPGGRIREVRFHADGCRMTEACGAVVAFHADGRALGEALFISPGLVLASVGEVVSTHLRMFPKP